MTRGRKSSKNLTENNERDTLSTDKSAGQAPVERGRPNYRDPEFISQRRAERNENGMGLKRQKLDLTAVLKRSLKDEYNEKVFRFVDDYPGRIHQMLEDDWEVVQLPDAVRKSGNYLSDKNDGRSQMDSQIVLYTGVGREDSTRKSVLLMKDKVLFELDEVTDLRLKRAEIERALTSGQAQIDVEGVERGTGNENSFYNPEGSISGMDIQRQLIENQLKNGV